MGDILLILGTVIYLGIGAYVADEEFKCGDSSGFDAVICGLLGAFWPLTLAVNWFLKS